jgi:hypothetical protein
MITTIMAGFAFGYCVMDIIMNYRARRAVDEMLKSTEEKEDNGKEWNPGRGKLKQKS